MKVPTVDEDLWNQIKALLPDGTPSRVPYGCGQVQYKGYNFDVWLADFDQIKIQPRRQKSHRGYDEPDHMDTVEGANSVEDPDIYQAVFGHPLKPGGSVQVFIDDDIHPRSRPYIAYHEIHEAADMLSTSMSYDTAHGRANAVEKTLRLRDHA